MAKKVRKVAFDPKVFLATIGGGRTLSNYQKDEVIFSQGKPADAVFYIQRGKVKITVVSQQGKEAIVAVLGEDEFCGEGCLAGQPRRMGTATAMTECDIMQVEKADIIRVLHEEPAFSEMFVSHLLARTIRVEEDLVDQLFNSSEKRLARALLLLANFGKEGRPEPVIAKISQETLAEMIGTTRSRVSFFMNKFRKLGLIDYNGHLEVHSSLLNVVLHDDPHINRWAEQADIGIRPARTALTEEQQPSTFDAALALHHWLTWLRAEQYQEFDGPAPVTEISNESQIWRAEGETLAL